MKIYRDIYDLIWKSFPVVPPESGGIFGSGSNGIVSKFFYDAGRPDPSVAIYTPNVFLLNRVILDWAQQGIRFCGMIHSHPYGVEQLSQCDMEYIGAIRSSIKDERVQLYFPIIIPNHKFISYVITDTAKGIFFANDPVEIIDKRDRVHSE